jgi:hypothetical protein
VLTLANSREQVLQYGWERREQDLKEATSNLDREIAWEKEVDLLLKARGVCYTWEAVEIWEGWMILVWNEVGLWRIVHRYSFDGY